MDDVDGGRELFNHVTEAPVLLRSVAASKLCDALSTDLNNESQGEGAVSIFSIQYYEQRPYDMHCPQIPSKRVMKVNNYWKERCYTKSRCKENVMCQECESRIK